MCTNALKKECWYPNREIFVGKLAARFYANDGTCGDRLRISKISVSDHLMIEDDGGKWYRGHPVQCHRHMPLLRAGPSPGSITNNSNGLAGATLRQYPSTFPALTPGLGG